MNNNWLEQINFPYTRVKFICKDCFSGGTPSTNNSDYWNGNIPWIASGKMQNCIVDSETDFITEKGLQNSSTRMIPRGSVGIAMTGATCANVGYIDINTTANQSVYSYILKDGYNSKYLFYSLIAMRYEILSKQNGGAQQGINGETCKNLYIPQLDLKTQTKVVEYLDIQVDKIDSTIKHLSDEIVELENLKTTITTEIVKKGINKNKCKKVKYLWIREMNDTYSLGMVKYDFSLHGRIGWQGLTTADYKEEGPYLITGTDFCEGAVDWNTCVHITDKRFDEDYNIHVKEGDLLITKDGTIGKIAIALNCPEKVSLNSGIMLIKPVSNKCLTKYLRYVLSSNIFWDWYYYSQRGNATIKHLYQEQFGYFVYPLPSIKEQEEIVLFLDKKCSKIDELIKIKSEKIKELNNYKKSLIYECVVLKKEV